MHVVEDVVGGKPKVQRARFFDGNRFVQRHVPGDLSWTCNDISARIAEGRAIGIAASSAGRTERGRVEPLARRGIRSEEHTSELQSHSDLVCRLLLEKKKSCSSIPHLYASRSTDRI